MKKCLLFHKWDGCTCVKCSTVRDKEHRWNGCKCTKCGKMRSEGHNWKGCTCTICGSHRDSGHTWEGDTCTTCGKKRKLFARYTGSGVCDVCNKSLADGKAWIVPNPIFYHSSGYLAKCKQQMAMFGMPMTDAEMRMELTRREAMDNSPGSAVCEDCIHLFEYDNNVRSE